MEIPRGQDGALPDGRGETTTSALARGSRRNGNKRG
jgi:hypothetical protein